MNSKILRLIVCLGVMALVSAKLEVSNFAQMNPSLEDPQLKDIPYSIANFGFAPFGKTIVAQLQSTPGLDKQCSYDSTKQTLKQIQSTRNIENSFLLIPRGDCPFVTKAIHAQEMGAKMAIIMDNQQHQRGIIMKDNGYGYKVTIPAIFINYKMGQKLMNLLNATNNKVVLRIAFENIKTDKADVIVYMQAMNRQAYYFIEQFQSFYNKIQKYVNLSLVYDVINCPRCNQDDCYYNGQYCSVNYEHGNAATGKLILDQQVREQIMFNKYNDKWWPYLRCINNQCNKISEIQQCSNKCLNSLSVKNMDQLMSEAYADSDNPILKQHLNILKNSGVEIFPSVTINGVRMRGSLNAEFVFDDICNTLSSPPKQCSDYITEQENRITSRHMSWVGVILVLIACGIMFIMLVLIFLIQFIFCRRRMRKRMTTEMQGRVDDMVSKYIEFYSQRNNRK